MEVVPCDKSATPLPQQFPSWWFVTIEGDISRLPGEINRSFIPCAELGGELREVRRRNITATVMAPIAGDELFNGSPLFLQIPPCTLLLDSSVTENDDAVCRFEELGYDDGVNIDQGQLTGGLTRIPHQHNRCPLFSEQPLWSEQAGKDLSLRLTIQSAEAVVEKHQLTSCKDCAGESLVTSSQLAHLRRV